MNFVEKRERLRRRKIRIRRLVHGIPARPRLTVSRSNNHIYAQIIDDTAGQTIVSASSLDPGLRSRLSSGGTLEAASAVGQLLAERASAVNIQKVVFDRGGRQYHGRIKALAEASRTGGLSF